MTAAARRSAKEIDPISREIAQTLARQSGMSLADWIASTSVYLRQSKSDIDDFLAFNDSPGVYTSVLETGQSHVSS